MEAGAATLRSVGEALVQGRAPERSDLIEAAVNDFEAALDEIRRRELTRGLSTEAVWRLFGAGFALEQFRHDLDNLIDRAEEFSAGRKADITG